MAKSNTLLFESYEPEFLVTECPSCYDVFKSVYPKLFRKPNYKVIHISELLKELLDSGKLKVGKGECAKKIIYKDPCPLVRRHGITEEPRQIVAQYAELLEFDSNRMELLCCGAPAGVKPLFPNIANRIAEMLNSEAAVKGADEIAVSCVFCMYHMGGASKEKTPLIRTLSQEIKEHLKG
ncbi:MAG: (Fe-S)-binding protein [Candidatus Methanomethylicus sp.]|nr:(Fe-S)-binding protein [Candidatus Methanomethylicus sp.]